LAERRTCKRRASKEPRALAKLGFGPKREVVFGEEEEDGM